MDLGHPALNRYIHTSPSIPYGGDDLDLETWKPGISLVNHLADSAVCSSDLGSSLFPLGGDLRCQGLCLGFFLDFSLDPGAIVQHGMLV